MNLVLICLALVSAGGDLEALKKDVRSGLAAGKKTFDHADLDAFLKACVKDGWVDYAAGKGERSRLDGYLAAVKRATLADLGRDELLALLIDTYNGATIALILDHYPGLKSIRDLPDPWKQEVHGIGGRQVSLDQIENEVLRPLFKDPRIHAALNCASVGCGPLRAGAFTGAGIDAQLDAQMRAWLADRRCARVDGEKLSVSHVFEWFRDDFTGAGQKAAQKTVPAFVAQYASGEVKAFLEKRGADAPIAYIDYDWSLNDAARRK